MNKVMLIGRLTRPVETHTVGDYTVANFAVAVDRPFKNAAGTHETDFIEVVAWRKLGELAAQYLVKGQQVAVEGRLQIRSYDATDGTKRKAVEVVADSLEFLAKPHGAAQTAADADPATADEATEEVPF